MSKVMLLMFLSILTQMFSATYNVDGFAYLEGETDHSGIEVFFQRVVPDTSFSYKVFTNSTGYYSCVLEQGFYNVSYSKDNYFNENITDVVLYSTITLSDITLSKRVSFITIPIDFSSIQEGINNSLSGDTILVNPGLYYENIDFSGKDILVASKFIFDADTNYINQTIIDGNKNDVVVKFKNNETSMAMLIGFTIRNGYSVNTGGGIFCKSSNPTLTNLKILNNTFEYASNYDIFGGGGICCFESLPLMSNLLIANNKVTGDVAYTRGGGIWFDFHYHYTPGYSISNLILKNNSCGYGGGGIFIDGANSVVMIENLQLIGNKSQYHAGGIYTFDDVIVKNTLFYRDSLLKGNYGGAFTANTPNVTMENVKFIENYSATYGGAISCFSALNYNFTNVLVHKNKAKIDGGGIYLHGYPSKIKLKLINCVISDNFVDYLSSENPGTGIYCEDNTELSIVNTIISNNSSYYQNGYSISLESETIPIEIINSNITNTEQSNFYNCGPYLGVIVSTNVNSDPCDAYGNVFMDPKFIDSSIGNLRLQADSPCIDAGTNTISGYEFPIADLDGNYRIWDGDGNGSEIVDMGVYEYDAPVGLENTETKILTSELYQNYPNPFNPMTSINFSLPQASKVELNVYNLNGQLVQSLVKAKQDKGMHKAEFNGTDLTSGIYIYSLKIDNKTVQSKKMMLIR